MFRRKLMPVWLGILALSGMFLIGQVGWNEPPPPEVVTVSILVRVDPLFPIEFDGLVGGDPVPYAEVTISGVSRFANAEGVVEFELLEYEGYCVHVAADTSEPDCGWRNLPSSCFYLTGPRNVTVDVWRDGPGCGAAPPVEISLLVRLNPQYPDEAFGVAPGDPVPYADVEITDRMSGELVASGTSDEHGEIVLEVPGISNNYIFGVADTSDPFCFFDEGGVLVVGTEPLDVILNLWVSCA